MDFVSKVVSLEGKQLRLQLWDTAGQERFRSLVPSYLRDSAGCVIVYDVTSRESFDSVYGWVQQVREGARRDVVLALVGNKIDLEGQRVVQRSEGEALAEELKMSFFEASASSAELVDAVFHGLARGLSCEPKAESDEEIVLMAPRNREAPHRKKKCC
ncbi:unnamed protein product [Effrenium voratum]|nr:unnamed protein product [Effrenium voratum]